MVTLSATGDSDEPDYINAVFLPVMYSVLYINIYICGNNAL